MAGTVFTIAQQKGGAGKTTLAIHLSTAWAAMGRSVAVLDIDPQGSFAMWAKLRQSMLGEAGGKPLVVAASGWRVSGEVERLARTHEIVVIDSPPHIETEARVAIRAAARVIVPIQPSVMDLWAIRGTLDLAKAEKVKALVVLNRMPARSKVADSIAEEAAKLGVPVAAATIGNRVALSTALTLGRGIVEHAPSSPAGQEIAALAAEILKG